MNVTKSSVFLSPGHGANGAATSFMQQPFSSGTWFSGLGVSSDPDSSSPLPSPPNPSSEATELPAPQDDLSSAGPGGDSSTDVAVDNGFDGGYANLEDEPLNSPEVSEDGLAYARYGYDGSAPGGNYGGSYGSSGSAYVGDSWTSGPANGYDAGDDPEPVFSDVSDLEPVYSFSSRSSYQRGRAVFAQTRYTPGEPVFQPMPVPRPIRWTSKAPTKGAF